MTVNFFRSGSLSSVAVALAVACTPPASRFEAQRDGSRIDGGVLFDRDSGVLPDGGEPDAGPLLCERGERAELGACVDVNECETDNGGCGNPAVVRCENRRASPPRCVYDCSADMQALAPTPTVLATPGATPSTLALLSATACPLGTNPTNDGVHVASLRLGSGKVVVASHNGLAAADVAFTSRVVGWVSPVAAPRIVVLGYAQVANQLAQAGLTNTAVDTLPALSAYDVLVMHGSSRLSDDDVTALRAFVESGKGLFVAGQSWSFNDSEGDAVANYGPNRLLRSAGIVILPTYSDGPRFGPGSRTCTGRATRWTR